MTYSPLPSPISVSWYRSCEVASLHYESNAIIVDLVDDDGRKWRLRFTDIQACKVTTEECAVDIIDQLPQAAGIFVTEESDWLKALGKGQIPFLDKSKHFVVPSYDEVVEVVAWNLDVELLDCVDELNDLR
ncbi:hypothetical protein D6779_00235 [Candidatus Parcubacteria bacterium]|nr:MAG: hypothetical protein D6779_00235 [Candidatus Parcubacteria bacterium]